MWPVFDLVTANIGMSFENTVLFALTVGGLIFFAKDFKLGIILEMLISLLCFIWFYDQSMSWGMSLTVFFVWLVILALTIRFVDISQEQGRFI